jgi:hypothetical protein
MAAVTSYARAPYVSSPTDLLTEFHRIKVVDVQQVSPPLIRAIWIFIGPFPEGFIRY